MGLVQEIGVFTNKVLRRGTDSTGLKTLHIRDSQLSREEGILAK